MQNIAILGSTGSIGQSALDVARRFPKEFKIIALSTRSNTALLYKQIKEFDPLFVHVSDSSAAEKLKGCLSSKVKLLSQEKGLGALACDKRVDKVLLAISGSRALLPLLEAVKASKQIALANKEALVMAGPLIMEEARKNNAKIIPVDSEQSAIWQCLDGKAGSKIKKVYLTASGGPLRQLSPGKLKNISIGKVLDHPRWKMGKKISVDSANLMNKGLELLEAMFLFNLPFNLIEVLVHPEAIIHSMVEFVDGVIMAQLSATDMRIPIQYAFSYPERFPTDVKRIDFCKLKHLRFEAPDLKKFPCLALSFRAAKELGTLPCVLNASNEVCVEEFLKERIKFTAIPEVIEKVLDKHVNKKNFVLEDILETDKWARSQALRVIEGLN